MSKFSIIVPVHNAALTLERCVDSVLSQDFGDFELILVENGSEDRSADICANYASTDPRVKNVSAGVCNGPSKPRNLALELCTGDYVAFLDSDDYVERDFLACLASAFAETEADSVFFGYVCESGDGEVFYKVVPEKISGNVQKDCLHLRHSDCFGYVCCKSFKRGLLGSVRFAEDMNLFEDEIFALQALSRAKSISVISRVLYHYVEAPCSLVKRLHPDIVEKKDRVFTGWRYFLGNDDPDALVALANDYIGFCRFYIYENGLDLFANAKRLRLSKMYRYAQKSPGKFTKALVSGNAAVALDYLCWRTKTAASCFKRSK